MCWLTPWLSQTFRALFVRTSKIWVQLILTIAISLVVVWTGVIIWQGHVYRQSALAQAQESSLDMHNSVVAGLTSMMVTGTVAQRSVYLDQVKQLGTIRDVRVLRGENVSKVFGPGNAQDDANPDSLEKQVLETGEEAIRIEQDASGEFLRAVRPLKALKNSFGKDCTQCHQVPEQSVLGAISMKVSLEHVNKGLAEQRVKSIIVALVTCIPVLLLIYPFIRKVITTPLEGGIEAAQDIAQGNLAKAIEVSSHNEMGQLQQALRDMSQGLVGIVSQVRSGTDAIFGASSEIAQGNLDLSTRTELQAATLESTALSMRELTATVRQNADNAREANQLAMTATDIAVKGGDMVGQVVQTMDSINASSAKIQDIIGVIDALAFQTNILALNAAVEAARAGEQGRGFAVVASEVRGLAQRSATAAKEIKQLIDDSVAKVGEGSHLVHQAGSTMKDIVGSIQHVTEIMGQIASGSAEQTTRIENINTAMADIDDVTQQNAALVEQAAAAAQSLQDQAAQLEQIVGVFKLS